MGTGMPETSQEAQAGQPEIVSAPEFDSTSSSSPNGEKKAAVKDEIHSTPPEEDEEAPPPPGKGMTAADKVDNMAEIALYALHVDDDPTLNPWTFRMWFLGLGLSAFAATLSTIYKFKPQGIELSPSFLGVVSYVLGYGMAKVIPRAGAVGRWLNPHDFNTKEHAAILIMSNTAAHAARAIDVLAVQRLWYDTLPGAAVCIFLIMASQSVGYGIAGLMRHILVYPTKFVWPINLPIMSLLETLHRDRRETRPQLKVFYLAFIVIFVWEVMPQYIMPILTAVNIFCLAKRDSMVFTRLFGGSNGNEGMGFLSLCFDFQYIGSSSLYLPLLTQANKLVGYILCLSLFSAIYYSNTWRSLQFPFLSQLLFTAESTSSEYVVFNQTAVLDPVTGIVDEDLLMAQGGPPFMAGTFASYVLTQNVAITATIVHLLLWSRDDLKSAWSFASLENFKKLGEADTWKFWRPSPPPSEEQKRNMDPHYRLMQAYADVPQWWYFVLFLAAFAVGLACVYLSSSGLSWYAFVVSLLLASVLILFTGAQAGLTGFSVPVQPIIQMIGAYMQPGRPVTNMYFTLFGYNSVEQGLLLLQDLKLGQYAKLSPRCTLTVQMVGTLLGSVLNYVIMLSITEAQREILLSIEGTHIWSGAQLQSFNTQAITWGGLASYLYSPGSIYQMVPLGLVIGFLAPLPTYFLARWFPNSPLRFDKIDTSIIVWHAGWMVGGINSAIVTCFLVAFWSQWYLRRYRPEWFLRFNYVLCAGLDGGTQVIIFILTFAVFGASGKAVAFPSYWGNNAERGNLDFCMQDPAS